MSIQLLLSDVDGTLVNKQKALTERTIAAVHRLEAAGVNFAVTSSRPAKGMLMLVEPLNIKAPLAGFNGGVLMSPDGKIISTKTIAPDAARSSYEICMKHGLDVWVFCGNDWYVPAAHGPHVDREAGTVQYSPVVDAKLIQRTEGVTKVVGVSDDATKVAACEAELNQVLGTAVSASRSQTYYVDITPPDANKGNVVGMLSDYYKIPSDAIATIGDSFNDVSMFRRSGLSIAMGNGSAEVQSEAKFVTAANDDEGFAKAIEQFILGEVE